MTAGAVFVAKSVMVYDHPHRATPAYERCEVCGLAEAAHMGSATPYRPEPTRPRRVTAS